MEVRTLQEVTERLEYAEEDFFGLIERFPHLIREPKTVDIMRSMKAAISDLRTAARRN